LHRTNPLNNLIGRAMAKRSIRVAGHPTSLSLEDDFWDALNEIATQKETSIPTLVNNIDTCRKNAGLSSAIRSYVLHYYRSGSPQQR
jgi:predicted DNA-binding ribbon-helix-helix protein